MKNPYQRKALSVEHNMRSNPKALYQRSIECIVLQTSVCGLYRDGWALCSTPAGQQAFAIWETKSLAGLLKKGAWQNYQTQEISLISLVHNVLPYLREQNTLVSLNLTPDGQNILVKPEVFLLDIKNFLYQLYIQKPEVFSGLKLPEPRSIRLN